MLSLRYANETLVSDEDPRCFIKDIEGEILLDRADQEKKIGIFRVIIIDVECAVSSEESVFRVFDTEQTTLDYYSLYDDFHEFKPSVVKAMGGDGRWEPNMLILDRLEIYPAYRGKTYGLHVLRWLQHHFSTGCGIVVMKPFPLQFEARFKSDADSLELHRFTKDKRKAVKALRDYDARLGFRRVPKTEYMVRDPMLRFPTLEECGLTNRVFSEEDD